MCLGALVAVMGWVSLSFASVPQSFAILNVDLPFVIVEAPTCRITNSERRSVSVTLMSRNFTHQSLGEVSIRGSSSAKHPKKPYRLELQDENGDDLKLSLLGMPKESDWILYPAYLDKTMIRDVLAYELWRQMGYWAPRTRYVHLFIITNSSSSSSSSSSSNDLASFSAFSGLSPSLSNSASSVSPVVNTNFASFSEFRGDAAESGVAVASADIYPKSKLIYDTCECRSEFD